MTRRGVRSARPVQRGQGLLLLMLVMLVAGASVLLAGIGSRASIRAGDDSGTVRALALAKEALIAYAVTDNSRPGELPCPDFNRDGVIMVAGPSADYQGSNCKAYLGWLPWQTLDVEDVRDGSGAQLWYAVSDAFHANGTTSINPDTPGGLTVDAAGATDIVAVIIAPGEPRGAQSRPADPPLGAPDASAHVAEYLEDGNANGDLGYVTSGAAEFNDRVVYITASELLRAVERRVLGEVAAALWAYRDANGAYPWLSPFADPIATTPASFDGVPGTRMGHLAYNDAADEGTHVQDTGFTITWDAGDAPISVVADSFSALGFELDPASALLMQESAEADAAAGSHTFTTPSNPTGGDPSCTWQGSNAVADCVATALLQPPYQAQLLFAGNPLFVQVRREISIDVAYTGIPAVIPPPVDGARVRDVASGATFQSFPDAAAVSTITVRHYLPFLPQIAITRRLTISQDSTASVNMFGIYLEPSAAGGLAGDLPAWFYANEWHRYVLVEYAGNALPGESLATTGTACTPGANCVNLDVIDDSGAIGVTLDDLHAVVIGAGAQIAGQDRYSGSAALADFFEEKNAVAADATAERRPWRSTWNFNDQARAVLQP
jgi:hypothetical protein